MLEAALDELLAKAAKRRGLTDRPLETPRISESDGIQLQFHHRQARALGGPPTVENIELRCRSHNLEAARTDFGDAWMVQFTGKPRRSSPPQESSAELPGVP